MKSIILIFSTVFITLKLSHVINWSWLWVLSPFWIAAVLFALLLIGAIIVSSDDRVQYYDKEPQKVDLSNFN